MNPLRLVGQAVIAAAVMTGIGYFSQAPAYQYFPPDHALIKLSLSHASQRLEPCRERTAEELAKLPPNMRRKMDCSRERVPTLVQLDVDGKRVFEGGGSPPVCPRTGPASSTSASP